MIRLDDTCVLTPKITPTEARMRVIASWKAVEPTPPPVRTLRIAGRVIGPLCEYATTLSDRVPFHSGSMNESLNLIAPVRILEPCFWEPEHPFCYEVQIELHDDDLLLDMRRIITGIRHLAVDGEELLLNGRGFFVPGVWHESAASITELEAWHDADCRAFLTEASPELCSRTDRWGPMILHLLPPMPADARDQVIRLRNHPSVLLWVVPAQLTGGYLGVYVETILKHDPSRPIAQLLATDQPLPASDKIDIVLLPAGHTQIGSPQCSKPFIVAAPAAGRRLASGGPSSAENFAENLARFRDDVGSLPGLVGLIL